MTLIEALVGIGILMLVMLAVSSFQRDFLRISQWSQGGLMRETQIGKAFKDFVNEVRSASTANTAAYVIEFSGANSFIFFVDTNGDDLRERIRYFMSGTSLRKGVITPTGCPVCAYVAGNEVITTIVTEITNAASIFSYYDETYNGSQAPLVQPVMPSSVRLVRIELTIDPNGSMPPGPQSFETEASIRNLRQL